MVAILFRGDELISLITLEWPDHWQITKKCDVLIETTTIWLSLIHVLRYTE